MDVPRDHAEAVLEEVQRLAAVSDGTMDAVLVGLALKVDLGGGVVIHTVTTA